MISSKPVPAEVLAIIPARGGSKGIPGKNLAMLAGKPLIAYTIENAINASWISKVVVSTDDAEIAAVSRQYGAIVVDRPAEISGDLSASESALIHTLDYLKRIENYVPDLCVFLQCTSPLTLPPDIDGTIQALIEQDGDTALAVTPFHYFLWKQDQTGNSVGVNHDKSERLLRQLGDHQFLETGAIYVMKTKAFLNKKHRFFGKTVLYVMPPERCLEIDDPVDLKIAEVLLRKQQADKIIALLPEKIEAVVFDFDGVFTNNKAFVNQSGQETVVCSRSDGMGISGLKELGLPLLVLSSETNSVVAARCRKLGIECRQGLKDKVLVLRDWVMEKGFRLENVIYLGNDINDNECIATAGCGVVVQDAIPDVKQYANIILSKTGGHGAIRELADMIKIKLEGNESAKKRVNR